MKVFTRLLAASGAAGLLIGLGGATQAFATTTPSFAAEIALTCGNVGDTQKISVVAPGDAVIHIEVTIGSSTANGGTQNGTGLTDANHSFIDQWTLGTVSANTTAVVRVWALESDGVATGNGTFEIHPQATACQTPFASRFNGTVIDTGQFGGSVKKTCDAGVSGTAVFAATIDIRVDFDTKLSTTFALPATLSLSLQCNGESKQLPVLPTTSTITLHESTLPTGAAAAADTTITIADAAVTATINNAKAVVATPTPTPTAIVLPATGQPASTPGIPWPALALFGVIAIAGAGLVLRRRS